MKKKEQKMIIKKKKKFENDLIEIWLIISG